MSIAVDNSATVTMPLASYNRIDEQISKLQAQVAEFETEKRAAQEGAPLISNDNPDAGNALRAAVEVVKYAVGNMPPEAHKGWPSQDLHELGELLRKNHDNFIEPEQATLGTTFIEFAKECEEIEVFRQNRFAAAQEIQAEPAFESTPAPVVD